MNKIVLRRASDIVDDVPTWAWEHDNRGRIALGTLALAAGRPGTGKSSFARHIASQITRGTLEGCWHGTPHNVAYIAREEVVEYVVKPSFRAHEADLSRVYFPEIEITGDDEETEYCPITIASVPQLAKDLKAAGVKFVGVDPLMSMVGHKTDVNRNNEVRAIIEPWRRLAEEIDGVVLGIAHLNKAASGDVVAGINGSSAFGEVARAVFGFAKDPDQRIMSQSKNSLGVEDLALTYEIRSVSITTDSGRTADFGQFVITGESDRTVGDVLRDPGRSDNTGDETDRERAADWLKKYIGGTKVDSAEAKKDGKSAGFSERTLQRARQELNVEIIPDGRKSFWSLPTCATDTPQTEGGTGGTGGTDDKPAGQSDNHRPMPPVPPVPVSPRGRDLAQIGCPFCDDPLQYDDDRRDGYHTSKASCVAAAKGAA